MSFYAKTESGTLDFTYGNMNYSVINGTATNEWQRFVITQTLPTTTRYPKIQTTEIGSLLLWGFQVEALPYATSYIPTSGAIATRLADSVTGAGDATTFNSTEGVLYAEIAALADGTGTRTMSLTDGTANNSITIRYTTSVGVIQALVVSGGSFQFSANISGVSVLDFNKIAVKYKQNDLALWINGVEVATDTSGTTPLGLSELNFIARDGVNNLYGKVKSLITFDTALTDAELECLTTI